MKLLVLNPNTSVEVSERLRTHVEAAAKARGVAAEVRVATASFGAAYISDEIGFAIAGHAALDAWAADAEAHGPADATLLGCFGDPAIEALRDLSGRPVVGLAEAALKAAARCGRFSIVTGGPAWRPILLRLVAGLGLQAALARIEIVAATGAELAADPERAVVLLGDACRVAAAGADAVVLGGAGLAGLAGRIGPAIDVPLIDSVAAGADALLDAAVAAAAPTDGPDVVADSGRPSRWRGLSAPLARRLG